MTTARVLPSQTVGVAVSQMSWIDRELAESESHFSDQDLRRPPGRRPRGPADRPAPAGVVTARNHLEHPAHRSNIEAIAVGFDTFGGLTDLLRTGFRTHRHSSTPVTPLDPRVHKKLASPISTAQVILPQATSSCGEGYLN